MQREQRLTGGKRFSLIHQEGRGRANRLLVMKTLSNGLDRSRFGFLVGKRLGGAVVRNKVKRRLREILRLTPVKAGWDIVFIARREAANADYHELKRATEDLLARARLHSALGEPPSASMREPGWPESKGLAEAVRNSSIPPSRWEAEA